MRKIKTVVVLSAVAIVLVLGIVTCIAINPLAAIGLAPTLAAISLIIRAISGGSRNPDDPHEAVDAPADE